MKDKIISFFQKLFALVLTRPLILQGKTTGYSLVRSQKAKLQSGKCTNVMYPFYIYDVNLGDYSYIAKNSSIANANIGKYCSIGPNFSCGLGIHPLNGISTAPMFYSIARQNGVCLVSENVIEESKRSIIGNDVFIGANVTVLDGVQIGHGAVIGAGSVVTKDIPPYAIAVGVPAKIVRYRFTEEQIIELLQIKWWEFDEIKLNTVKKFFFDIENFILACKK